MHHTYLHTRVLFAARSSLLCTVDCNNNIYGWSLDGRQDAVFEVSRHKGLVTDIIAIDKHNLFASCSLDKRVVLWSQTTRRVKGVLLGHKRGVTRLSAGRDTLLTSGFECEARTWDLNLREPQLVLRGHRLPISDSKVMCREGTVSRCSGRRA
jgi:WD40 repeat protein